MFKVTVENRVSKKGNPFTCLVVEFPNGYKKIVFLEGAEIFMASQYLEK